MKIINYVAYLAFRLLLLLIRITPFGLLYFISDCFRFFILDIVRYRVNVVKRNLNLCFPDKSDSEKKIIMKNFFRHFTDLFLESLKGYTLKTEKVAARYTFPDKSPLLRYYSQGKSVILAFSHYGNWEWATQTVLFEHKHRMAALYKPLHNTFIDNYIKTCRQKRGTHLCPIEKTKFMFGLREKQPMGFVLLGDQNPSNTKRAFWVDFFGIDTCSLHGIEVYSKMFNLPVIYVESAKIARGHYELHFSDIVPDPSICTPGQITQIYMKSVENSIRRGPEFWLWSHKRWKRTRLADGSVVRSNYYE